MLGKQTMISIQVHANAPSKPTRGAECNGCGLCCLAEPCPVSRFLLGHRQGPCPALRWQDEAARYVCAMVAAPTEHLRWLPRKWNAVAGRLFQRWIAAGIGCDFDADEDHSPKNS